MKKKGNRIKWFSAGAVTTSLLALLVVFISPSFAQEGVEALGNVFSDLRTGTAIDYTGGKIWAEDILVTDSSQDSDGIYHPGKRGVIVELGCNADMPEGRTFQITLKSGKYSYGTKTTRSVSLQLRVGSLAPLQPRSLTFMVPSDDPAFIENLGFAVDIQ